MSSAEPRAYVDTPIGDVTAATAAARTAAERFGLPDPGLHRSSMNAVFNAGDVVLRVSRTTVPAERALALAEVLAGAGISVASPARSTVVHVGSLSVTAWERLVPVDGPVTWDAIGALVQRVHALDVSALPDGLPTPRPTSFPWWRFEHLLVEVRPLVDVAAFDGLAAVVERHPGWRRTRPADDVVCHGDVHPGNVVQTAAGPVLVDWDLLCRAPRGWDHAPLMRWSDRWGGAPDAYAAFASGYGRSFRGDPFAEAVADLRLVAATIMAIRAAATDPRRRDEAERRLRWWRGEEDAPVWRSN